MILYYVRHADPIYDPDSLTPLGLRQAEAVGRRLASRGLHRIYSSTSNRAILTATPASELTGKPIETLDWCHEKHAGHMWVRDPDKDINTWCFNVTHYRRLFNRRDVRALGMEWYRHEAFADTGFAKGVAHVERECDNFLLSLGYRHDREACVYIPERENNERVALFAHQSIGFLILSSILDIPYPLLSTHTDITRSSVSAIEFTPHDGIVIPRMISMSNEGHLYRDGLPCFI